VVGKEEEIKRGGVLEKGLKIMSTAPIETSSIIATHTSFNFSSHVILIEN